MNPPLHVLDLLQCHLAITLGQATGDSPGAEILHRIASSSPRVLGLTASYANDKATTAEGFQQSRRTLQAPWIC